MLRNSVAAVLLSAVCLGGCAAATPPPVQVDAALGRVVIYRNGVAYFERNAVVRGDELTIRVPAERVDDFLKSLTIVDANTGKSLNVSFPTMETDGDDSAMTIQLPKASSKNLRISYVTESPAWKPSYRVILRDKKPSKLEAWAIVDNVSGEDWKKVTVGVGSTSALSFRYDLHSVRFVERETLSDNSGVALAPPTGGSPYAVASGEVQLIGNLDVDEVAELDKAKDGKAAGIGDESLDAPGGASARSGASTRSHQRQRKFSKKRRDSFGGANVSRPMKPATDPAVGKRQRAQSSVERIRRLAQSGKKIVIEGYAQAGDSNPRDASLTRANTVRNELINQGVKADQLEAVGTGRVARGNGVRVLMKNVDHKPAQPAQKSESGRSSDEPIGSAYFLANAPMSIRDGHSAMVSLLATEAEAEQVYYYDPISSRGSKKFAFKAVHLTNPSNYTLDGGPFTVYAEGQFLGEGLSEPIPPKSDAFIPFALDKKLVVEPKNTSREEIDSLVTIERGIVTAEAQRIRRTALSLHNRGTSPATVYVRHSVAKGWKLRDTLVKFEKLRGAYLFPLTVPARSAAELLIEESMPIQKTVDIRTESGVKDLALFLDSSSKLHADLQDRLKQIVKMHRDMVDLQERIHTVHKQMSAYRQRVDEINVQLVTLRKVTHATQLKRHLAKKMEEISERLQQATIDVTDLEGKVLTSRIELQDRLAELRLRKEKKERVAASPPPPRG